MSTGQAKAAEGPKQPAPSTPGGDRKMALFDKSLTATANLVRLLPTGTTMVFETLAPSFTNHGHCYYVNHVFSWGLIAFLCSVCVFLSFTDSIIDPADDNTHYGLALPIGFYEGFYVFNYDYKKCQSIAFTRERRERSVRARDFVHALLRALVFVSLAFDNAEVQTCLLGTTRMTVQWKEFLVNMPLATGLLASFVFMVFPSSRNGFGYDVSAAALKNSNPADARPSNRNAPPPANQGAGASGDNREVRIESIDPLQITVAAGRVAPSTSYELDSVV